MVTIQIHPCGEQTSGMRTMSAPLGSSVTFNWNGICDGDITAQPGVYTYEIFVEQSDRNPDPLFPDDPTKDLLPDTSDRKDHTIYRSDYLLLTRASDENGQLIYDVDYDGYDDKGTPEESDDDYIYIIRWYALYDMGPAPTYQCRNASEGTLTLYDPELVQKCQWNLAGLECILHEDNDGLRACPCDEGDITHAIRVPVPVSSMDEAGTYRFVLHVVDDHAADYRDHGFRKPAMDLNGTDLKLPIEHFQVGNYYVAWCRASSMGKITKGIAERKETYAVRNWVNDVASGKERASVNGGFFHMSTTEAIGNWADGSGWKSGQLYVHQDYAFSMDATGSSFVARQLSPKRTHVKGKIITNYVADPDVKAKNHGLGTVGLLVKDGAKRTGRTSWPDYDTARPRTAIAWSKPNSSGARHFFMVATSEASWTTTADFFSNSGSLRSEMKRLWGENVTIEYALMLDGGGSTSYSLRARDAKGSIITRKIGGQSIRLDQHLQTSRKIHNIVRAEASTK